MELADAENGGGRIDQTHSVAAELDTTTAIAAERELAQGQQVRGVVVSFERRRAENNTKNFNFLTLHEKTGKMKTSWKKGMNAFPINWIENNESASTKRADQRRTRGQEREIKSAKEGNGERLVTNQIGVAQRSLSKHAAHVAFDDLVVGRA